MKNILITTKHLGCGGVEKALLSLIKYLKTNGKYNITLRVMDKSGEFAQDFLSLVKIEEINLPKDIKYEILYGRKKAIKILLKEFKIAKVLKSLVFNFIYKDEYKKYEKILKNNDNQFDIAIDYLGYASFFTYYIAYEVRAKNKITWIHSDFLLGNINITKVKEYYNEYNSIVAVSEKAADSFRKLIEVNEGKLKVINNVIDSNEIINKSVMKIDTKLQYENYNIVTVGRLSPEKNYILAVRVLSELVKINNKIKWYVIGEGPQRNEIENEIKKYNLKDNFILLGMKKNPYPYIKKCDLYAQLSKFEGYCTALNEAKILGALIITTNVGGVKEQFVNEYNAIIVEEDIDEIIYSIKKLILNKEYSKDIKTRCIESNVNSISSYEKIVRVLDGE